MEITKTQGAKTLTVTLAGRLDTVTSKLLEAELPALSGSNDITLDCEALEYVSSAGLRVLLVLQKQVDHENGLMRLVNVCGDVMEVFEMTGFTGVLRVE